MSCPDIKLQLLQKRIMGKPLKREDRVFLLNQGICPKCQKRAVEPNRKMCYECLGHERDRYHQRKAEGSLKKKIVCGNSRKMSEYYRRKEAGLCTKCGQRKAEQGLLCNRCYAKYRTKQVARQDDIRRSERPAYGRCYICGTEELYDGHKVCRLCYEKRLETLPAMWAHMDNSYFRSQNDLEYTMRNSDKQKGDRLSGKMHIGAFGKYERKHESQMAGQIL